MIFLASAPLFLALSHMGQSTVYAGLAPAAAAAATVTPAGRASQTSCFKTFFQHIRLPLFIYLVTNWMVALRFTRQLYTLYPLKMLFYSLGIRLTRQPSLILNTHITHSHTLIY